MNRHKKRILEILETTRYPITAYCISESIKSSSGPTFKQASHILRELVIEGRVIRKRPCWRPAVYSMKR